MMIKSKSIFALQHLSFQCSNKDALLDQVLLQDSIWVYLLQHQNLNENMESGCASEKSVRKVPISFQIIPEICLEHLGYGHQVPDEVLGSLGTFPKGPQVPETLEWCVWFFFKGDGSPCSIDFFPLRVLIYFHDSSIWHRCCILTKSLNELPIQFTELMKPSCITGIVWS